MPSYVRSSPQLFEDIDSSSSSLTAGVFGGGRSSGTSNSLNRDYHSGQNEPRSKRRKVLGANSRFDRMIETMNMTNRSPTTPSRQSQTRSIGSSSTSYCDFPQTPAEAYDNQNAGPLGKDFSLIKMNTGHFPRSLVNMDDPLYNVSMTKPTSGYQDPQALPPWLSNTLTSLDSKHPLRLLLPKSPRPSLPPGLVEHSRGITTEDEPVFAFLPRDVSPECDDLTPPSGYVNMEKNGSHTSNISTTLQVLPFSTSGPGSHIPGLHPLVSPRMNTSSRVQNATSAVSDHDSVLDDDDIHNLDFVPFLTPGPGSLISMGKSRSKSPQFLGSAFAEDLTSRFVIDSSTAGLLDSALFSTSGSTFLAPAFTSDDTTSLQTSADPCLLLSYVPSTFDTAAGYSSDEMPDYNLYYDDSLADDSASDPSFDHSAYTKPLPNLFATPGPGYQPPQQIYFDSPTEDLFDSDSLQPGHRIDYETLDFHWKPFNRKDTNIMEPKNALPSMSLQPAGYRAQVDIEQEIVQATDSQDQSHTFPLHGRVLSPSPFAFLPGSQNEGNTNHFFQELPVQAREVTPGSPRSQRQMPPPFAPAPGIFLSPLREAVVPKSLDEATCEPTIPCQKTNLLCALDRLYASPKNFSAEGRPDTSLSSNDSIESWQDVGFEL